MTDKNVIDFVGRYGPWAVIVGASEGVGAAFARQTAERGLNVACWLDVRLCSTTSPVSCGGRSVLTFESSRSTSRTTTR